MNDRPKDTNGAWLFLLFFLGLVYHTPTGFVRFCARTLYPRWYLYAP